jgi:hypothetical protein
MQQIIEIVRGDQLGRSLQKELQLLFSRGRRCRLTAEEAVRRCFGV